MLRAATLALTVLLFDAAAALAAPGSGSSGFGGGGGGGGGGFSGGGGSSGTSGGGGIGFLVFVGLFVGFILISAIVGRWQLRRLRKRRAARVRRVELAAAE